MFSCKKVIVPLVSVVLDFIGWPETYSYTFRMEAAGSPKRPYYSYRINGVISHKNAIYRSGKRKYGLKKKQNTGVLISP